MCSNSSENSLVSIIVPAYNVQDYIEECIASLCAQTYKNIEIILVNDGSTDKTGELCDAAAQNDARVKVVHQQNGGVVRARKSGLEIARGKYVSFVDADDWVEPNMIEEMLTGIGDAELISTGVYRERIKKHPEVRVDNFEEGIYVDDRLGVLLENLIYDVEQEKLQPFTPWLWNKLYLTSMVVEVNSQIEENLKYAEDSAFLYAYLVKCNKIVISHKPYYHYRYREDSTIHRVNEFKIDEIMQAYRCMKVVLEGREQLQFQLRKWLISLICGTLNNSVGLDKGIYIPEFSPNLRGMDGKRVILYGAGSVGKSYHAQMTKFGYDIVAWADRAYENYLDRGVIAPEKIIEYEYDIVFIAIESQGTAEKIKKALVELGVQEEKIAWRAPYRIF